MRILKLSIIALAVTSIVGCKNEEKPHSQQMPPKMVKTITVKEAPVKIQSELKGRLAAIEEAEVRPQITGIIQSVKVKDGQEVKAGDILYKVDSAQYQAAYNQALASYNSVKADIETAKLKAERYEQLAKSKAVPIQDADDAKSNYNRLLASLEERKAAVEMAKINLNYTDIKAPIDGRIGITTITTGALVTANQAASINSITKLDPIYLDVTQQSKEFLEMMKLSKSLGTKEIPVEIRVKQGDEPIIGSISSNEVKVDPQTDSVKLRAKFSNKEKSLLPGMFGYATITYAIQDKGIKIPLQTVVRNSEGKSTVYVVNKEQKIEQVAIEVLQNTGFEAIITSGLKEGDKVVIEGIDKIKAGDAVVASEQNKE